MSTGVMAQDSRGSEGNGCLPVTHLKEHLSLNYLRAVAARAGFAVLDPDITEYGIDLVVSEVRRSPHSGYAPTGWLIPMQVKATTVCEVRCAQVVYELEAKAYNKLVEQDGPVPCILVVFRLPPHEEDWLLVDEDAMLLRHCAYWDCLSGAPLEDRSSITIHIPKEQVLTPRGLNGIMQRAKRGWYQ